MVTLQAMYRATCEKQLDELAKAAAEKDYKKKKEYLKKAMVYGIKKAEIRAELITNKQK